MALFENLCGLARLRLAADDAEAFADKFARLLEFVERTQAYEPLRSEPPLTSSEAIDLRKDVEVDFPWPRTTRHDYRVPKIIDFEGEG